MGALYFLKPKKTPVRPILTLLTEHRMDCLILCLRCLERFTDLEKFKRIYILAGAVSDAHMAVARKFERRHANVRAVDCRPRGRSPAVILAENLLMEKHAGDVIVKMDEAVFVTPLWLERLLDGYRAHRRDPDTPVLAPLMPVSNAGRRVMSRFLKYAYPSERGMFLGPPVDEDWVYHRWIWQKILRDGLVETYLEQTPPHYVYQDDIDDACLVYDRRLLELIHPLPLSEGEALETREETVINRALRENKLRAAVMARGVVHRYSAPRCQDYLRAHVPLDDVWGYLDEVRVPRLVAPKRPPRSNARPVLTLVRP